MSTRPWRSSTPRSRPPAEKTLRAVSAGFRPPARAVSGRFQVVVDLLQGIAELRLQVAQPVKKGLAEEQIALLGRLGRAGQPLEVGLEKALVQGVGRPDPVVGGED